MQKNIYNTLEYTFFKLNSILNKSGKTTISEKIIIQLFLNLSEKKKSPVRLIIFALEAIKPLVKIKQIRIRGLYFSVPLPQSKHQQFNYILHLLLNIAKKDNKKLSKSLTEEILNVYNGKSIIYSDITKLNILAIKNKTFSSYRWF